MILHQHEFNKKHYVQFTLYNLYGEVGSGRYSLSRLMQVCHIDAHDDSIVYSVQEVSFGLRGS